MKMDLRLVDVYEVPKAKDVLWEILVERGHKDEACTNISHDQTPSRQGHENFVGTKPFYKWYLIGVDEKWVGQIRLSWRNEIGVGLLRQYRGRGYGPAAVRKLMDIIEPLPYQKSRRRNGFIANINPDNARSIRLFQRLGFQHIQNTYLFGGGR